MQHKLSFDCNCNVFYFLIDGSECWKMEKCLHVIYKVHNYGFDVFSFRLIFFSFEHILFSLKHCFVIFVEELI